MSLLEVCISYGVKDRPFRPLYMKRLRRLGSLYHSIRSVSYGVKDRPLDPYIWKDVEDLEVRNIVSLLEVYMCFLWLKRQTTRPLYMKRHRLGSP